MRILKGQQPRQSQRQELPVDKKIKVSVGGLKRARWRLWGWGQKVTGATGQVWPCGDSWQSVQIKIWIPVTFEFQVNYEYILKEEPVGFCGWLGVRCGRRKGSKDDIRSFGLRNWRDRIAVTGDREEVVSEQGWGKDRQLSVVFGRCIKYSCWLLMRPLSLGIWSNGKDWLGIHVWEWSHSWSLKSWYWVKSPRKWYSWRREEDHGQNPGSLLHYELRGKRNQQRRPRSSYPWGISKHILY